MKFRIVLFAAIILLVSTVMTYAQLTIKLNILDDSTKNQIPNVEVILTQMDKRSSMVSNTFGICFINIKRNVPVRLQLSHPNYKNIMKINTFFCDSCKTINDTIFMVRNNSKSINLKEIVIKGKTPLVVMKNDTTSMNANNYKVNKDANAEELITKMPGILNKNGSIEAHGEKVKQVLLDGKEFFNNDVTMALRNLPANTIQEIQIFDQLSDFSKLSGFDDGNRQKTINIITKKEISLSKFGEFHSGSDAASNYDLYGTLNLFKNKRRLSVFSQSNDLNIQNFSKNNYGQVSTSERFNGPQQSKSSTTTMDFHPTQNNDNSDFLLTGSNDGIITTHAAGINYTNKIGEKLDFAGLGFVNYTGNELVQDIYRNYLATQNQNHSQLDQNNSRKLNHRYNFKIEYSINKKNTILIHQHLAYQTKDNCKDLFGRSFWDNKLLNSINFNESASSDILYNKSEILYIYRFNNKGRFFSTNFNFDYGNTKENILSNSLVLQFDTLNTKWNYIQKTTSSGNNNKVFGVVTYAEPLNRYCQLKVDLGAKISVSKQSKVSQQFDAITYVRIPSDSILSGRVFSKNIYQFARFSFLYTRRSLSFSTGIDCRNMKTLNQTEIFLNDKTYKYFLPYTFLKYRFGQNNQLNLIYKSDLNLPLVYQLQSSTDNSNPISLITGNINLKPTLINSLVMRLILPRVADAGIIVFFINAEQSENYIGNRCKNLFKTQPELGKNNNAIQWISYENLSGYRSSDALLGYGFPLSFIKSNVNISSLYKYSNIPGSMDNLKSMNKEVIFENTFTVGSNISNSFDYVIDFNSQYFQSKNSLFSKMAVNYWRLSFGSSLTWFITPSWKLIMEGGYTKYKNLNTTQYNKLISNSSIAYKFMKRKQAEIKISVNDIFNQNTAFVINTMELYKQINEMNTIKRYFLFSFIYKLNYNQNY